MQKLHAADEDETQFLDPRNNSAFWARPPQHIRELVNEIQQEIQAVAPSQFPLSEQLGSSTQPSTDHDPALWFMPSDHLHMTTLEIISARTVSEVEAIVSSLKQSGSLHDIVNYTLSHRARLVKPMVNYDASAIAVSFVPAARGAANNPQSAEGDKYTYHHLRSELFDIVTGNGCPIASRYTVPSAHLTIARFITQDGFLLEESGPEGSFVDRERIALLVDTIEKINRRLQTSYWQREYARSRGEWVVGQEKGLELVKGRTWYGKGDSVLIGEGFS